MFSCEIYEIFENTYFEEHLRTTASKKIVIEGISYFGKAGRFLHLHDSILYGWWKGLQLLKRPSNWKKIMQYQILFIQKTKEEMEMEEMEIN